MKPSKYAKIKKKNVYHKLAYFKKLYQNSLFIYDFIKHTTEKIDFDNNLTNNSDILQIRNSAYITGGGLSTKSAFPCCFHINLDNFALTEKSNMKFPKYCHCSVSINNKYLYTIGGKTPTKFYKVVEKYNIRKDYWSAVPSLNKEKANISSISVNERFIYSFFGISDTKIYTVIEKFDVLNEENGWTILKNANEKHEFPNAICGCSAFQISAHDILIFGGRMITDSKESYKYDLLKNQMKKETDLLFASSFYTTNYIIREHKYYTADFINHYIYQYNGLTKKWSIHNQQLVKNPNEYSLAIIH